MHPVTHGSTMNVYPFRVAPGIELTSYLKSLVAMHDLKAAFIVTCVGSVKSVNLRFATNAEGNEATLNIVENMEICSLNGTICNDGFHLHGTFGNVVGGTVSGHILGNMVIQTTAEVVLGDAGGWKFSRKLDAKTGFKELAVTSCKSEKDEPPPA